MYFEMMWETILGKNGGEWVESQPSTSQYEQIRRT
jgi:hypothetical protein